MKFRSTRMAPLMALGLVMVAAQYPTGLSAQEGGLPYPDASTPRPVDLGPLVAHASSTPISVTVALSAE